MNIAAIKPPKLFRGLGLLVILSALVSCQFSYHYSRGVGLSQKRQYADAIVELSKEIQMSPSSALAHYQRGFAYVSVGSNDLGMADFTAAITLNKAGILERYSLLHLCYYNRGVSYHATDRMPQAIADYTSALAIKADFAEAYANRGKAYGDIGDKERALADLRKAVEINPSYKEQIGPMIEKVSRISEATKYFEKGLSAAHSGQNTKAIAHFSKAIEIDKDYALAYANRGAIYGKTGQIDKSFSDLNKAIELNPSDDLALNNRGRLYIKLKQYDKAMLNLKKAIEINPRQYLAYRNIGYIYNSKGENDLAIKNISKAVEINPRYLHGYVMRGIIYQVKRKRYDKALLDFGKAIDLNPNYAPAYNSKSWILATCPEAKYRNGEAALKLAQESVKLERDCASLRSLAASYAELGDFEKAIKTQKQSIDLINTNKCVSQNKDISIKQLDSYKKGKPWRDRKPQQQSIIIGTGGSAGMYFPTGKAICRVVNKGTRSHGIYCTAKTTKGSVDNLRAFEHGDLQFGIAKSDRVYQAYRGFDIWRGMPQKNLRTIFSVHSESVHLIADSTLYTIQDLKGKNVNIGNPGSMNNIDALATLKAFQIDRRDIDESRLKRNEAVELFQKGQLDAIFYTVGDPSGITRKTSEIRNVNIIPLDGHEIDELIIRSPFYDKVVIPEHWYHNLKNKQDIPSFGYKTIFFTSAEASEEVVYSITREVFNNLEKFKKQHPAYEELTKQNMVEIIDRLAPIHPGALRYYKEVGLK